MPPFQVKTGRTRTTNGCFAYWWSALQTLPLQRDSLAYERLRRVWEDQTRLSGAKESAKDRRHEFVQPTHETHLTATLWENFALFRPVQWLPAMLRSAGMEVPEGVGACQWSYEWENEGKLCDLVIAYRDHSDRRHVIIVESKNLHAVPSMKDLDESYYLGMGAFAPFNSRRLLFCVDQTVRDEVAGMTARFSPPPGIITWQDLGGVQVALAAALDATEEMRAFVAGAIQFQFAVHDIRPTVLAAPYLGSEPSIADLYSSPAPESHQTTAARARRLWDV